MPSFVECENRNLRFLEAWNQRLKKSPDLLYIDFGPQLSKESSSVVEAQYIYWIRYEGYGEGQGIFFALYPPVSHTVIPHGPVIGLRTNPTNPSSEGLSELPQTFRRADSWVADKELRLSYYIMGLQYIQ